MTTTPTSAQGADELLPIMFNGKTPIEDMDIGLLCQILKKDGLFDGDGLQVAWNDLVCFYVANRRISTPSTPTNARIEELETLCAEAYQVVGVLAADARRFDDAAVTKALDNLYAQKLVHADVLPFLSAELSTPQPAQVTDEPAIRAELDRLINKVVNLGYACGAHPIPTGANMASYDELCEKAGAANDELRDFVLSLLAAQAPTDLNGIEQYRMQMAGISTAALGHWKAGDPIHPDYDTPALRDVAKLYANYDALHKQVHAAQADQADSQDAEKDDPRTAHLGHQSEKPGSETCGFCGGDMASNKPCSAREHARNKDIPDAEVAVFGCQMEADDGTEHGHCEKWCKRPECPVSFKSAATKEAENLELLVVNPSGVELAIERRPDGKWQFRANAFGDRPRMLDKEVEAGGSKDAVDNIMNLADDYAQDFHGANESYFTDSAANPDAKRKALEAAVRAAITSKEQP